MSLANGITCKKISLDQFTLYDEASCPGLQWSCPFVLPFWLRSWASAFGADSESHIVEIRQKDTLLGIAPLMIQGNVAQFLGDENVCDYQDMVLAYGSSQNFYATVLDYLSKQGVSSLKLGALIPDSTALTVLPGICQTLNLSYTLSDAGSIYSIALPSTWDVYLQVLQGKQRHEVRRKMRRLHEAGEIAFSYLENGSEALNFMAEFLKMFSTSRADKADFLTEQMKSYFYTLAAEMADNGMLRLGVLSIDQNPVASIFGFTFKNALYLYNNGYLRTSHNLSTGLMCKVFALMDSIDKSAPFFHLLKGDEKYKKQLGGKQTPLKRLKIELHRD